MQEEILCYAIRPRPDRITKIGTAARSRWNRMLLFRGTDHNAMRHKVRERVDTSLTVFLHFLKKLLPVHRIG